MHPRGFARDDEGGIGGVEGIERLMAFIRV